MTQLLSLSEQVAPCGKTFYRENIAPTLNDDAMELNQSPAHAAEVPLKVSTRRRRDLPGRERLDLLRKQAETKPALLKTIRNFRKTKVFKIKAEEKCLI